MKRYSMAVWSGTIKNGDGHITSESKALDNVQYSYKSRFEEGIGTNPEELMAAAHAGCFTMKLSADLTTAGFEPKTLETQCDITIDDGVITSSKLTVTAKVSGIKDEEFQEIAEKAKQDCPVSKAYNLDISLEATLQSNPADKQMS